jgi:hypothetical protein
MKRPVFRACDFLLLVFDCVRHAGPPGVRARRKRNVDLIRDIFSACFDGLSTSAGMQG